MNIQRATLETCVQATGSVIVIDVLRAFTTAAYAFAAGAADIRLVATVEEAFTLRQRNPGYLLMGEVDGLPIEGFDFGNSPSALLERDLSGRHLIQRTSAGTQGVVRSRKADTLLAASLVCAGPTANYVHQQGLDQVTLVITGYHPGGWGDEDAVCADYLEALLKGESPDQTDIIRRVRETRNARRFSDPASDPFPAADLDCALAIDRFDFALLVRHQNELLVMEPVKP